MEGIFFEPEFLNATVAGLGLLAMLAVVVGAILFGYLADEEARGRRFEWLEESLVMAGEPAQAEEVILRKAA